jgi:hypothetical protein
MSWQIFKSNILARVQDPNNLPDIDTVATLYATEYDNAIKRGTDTLNKIPLIKSDVNLMKQMFRIALLNGQNSKVPFDLVGEMGQGVIFYWTGAELAKSPIPIIPAIGSTLNVSITSAICTTPGQWTPQTPLPPTNDPSILIDLFIATATIHLQTVSGIINTISLYPPIGTPGPGIINWSGYFVPPSQPGGISAPPQSEFKMSEQDIAVKEEEKAQAEEIVNNPDASEEQKSTATEYVSLTQDEIDNKEFNSIEEHTITSEQVDSIAEVTNSDPSFECPIGLKVVAAAKKDIGIIETGTTANNGAGKNYGGKTNPNGEIMQEFVFGRIDAMVSLAGLDNQAEVRATGQGYYWCASAVTAWWKAAGLPTPPGSASCRNWASWAKSNGLYSHIPTVGAAVLYGAEGKEHHIGIVASVNNGRITTIEGNTGGGGFNRNGCGCFLKNPNIKNISGYVIPPGCNK